MSSMSWAFDRLLRFLMALLVARLIKDPWLFLIDYTNLLLPTELPYKYRSLT